MGSDRGVNDDLRRPECRSSPMRRLPISRPSPTGGRRASGARKVRSAVGGGGPPAGSAGAGRGRGGAPRWGGGGP
ncbi:hypothetical protein FSC45_29115, partial [Pseudomonas aeruginosa]